MFFVIHVLSWSEHVVIGSLRILIYNSEEVELERMRERFTLQRHELVAKGHGGEILSLIVKIAKIQYLCIVSSELMTGKLQILEHRWLVFRCRFVLGP